MNRTICFVISLGLLLVGTIRADEIVPKRTEFSRYQAMLDRSPFAVATAAALPAATPSFAKDIYIANAARSPEGDLVTLNSASDKNFKEYLTTKEPNLHGYGIANIEWSDRIGATKVTVSKDGQFATVTFNQALLSSSPGAGQPPGFTPPQPQPQPQQGAAYPQQQHPVNPVQAKPVVPGVPTPPPRTRGVIPRNPSVNAPPHVPNAIATPPLPPNTPVEDE